MHAFIERCQCLFRGSCSESQHTSFLEGKRQAFIIISADSFNECLDQIRKTIQKMQVCYRVNSAGELFVCDCGDSDEAGENIEFEAINFSKHLLKNDGKMQTICIPG